MKTRLLVLGVVLALLISFGVGTPPAQANGRISSYSIGCSRVTVSGWTDAPLPDGAVYFHIDLYAPFEHIQGGNWPVDADGNFTVVVNFAAVSEGRLVRAFGWDADTVWEVFQACSDPAFQGPPIPSGFVLKTITCDVPVYDAPGGKPVGSNAITAGQTWYVNPTPVKAPNGEQWTEIFVAGYSTGFVPTRCVH